MILNAHMRLSELRWVRPTWITILILFSNDSRARQALTMVSLLKFLSTIFLASSGWYLLVQKVIDYRGGNKVLFVLLSRTQAGPGRTVKQEQEEISRNHVQAFIPPLYSIEQLNCPPVVKRDEHLFRPVDHLRQGVDDRLKLFGRPFHGILRTLVPRLKSNVPRMTVMIDAERGRPGQAWSGLDGPEVLDH